MSKKDLFNPSFIFSILEKIEAKELKHNDLKKYVQDYFVEQVIFYDWEKEVIKKRVRSLKKDAQEFSNMISIVCDELLAHYLKEEELYKEPVKDTLKNFPDYELKKSKLRELMCDKATATSIGLSTLLELGKANKIKSIVINERGDRKFSVQSAIQWAMVNDKKIYRAMLKNLGLDKK